MNFIEVRLTKATVYLSPEEVHSLLLTNIQLYKKALARGKSFERNQSKKTQYENKFKQHEAQSLNNFMQ